METCKDRINQEFKEFVHMLKVAYNLQKEGYIDGVGEDIYFTKKAQNEDRVNEIYDKVRTILCVDEVEANTFGHNKPYKRYQFSWGGPSDEVRVYENGTAQYWFLDWFDGAYKKMGKHLVNMLESVYN